MEDKVPLHYAHQFLFTEFGLQSQYVLTNVRREGRIELASARTAPAKNHIDNHRDISTAIDPFGSVVLQ